MDYAQFALVGSLEGQTINLGGHQFVDGVFTFGPNEDNVVPSDEEVRLKGIALARNYQAFRLGTTDYEAAVKRLKGGEAPEGELDVAQRETKQQQEQQQAPVEARARGGAIRTAIGALDPDNDAHWTSTGLPAVEAVRELSKFDDVSRADITNLAPNLTRDEAKKVKSGDPLDQ